MSTLLVNLSTLDDASFAAAAAAADPEAILVIVGPSGAPSDESISSALALVESAGDLSTLVAAGEAANYLNPRRSARVSRLRDYTSFNQRPFDFREIGSVGPVSRGQTGRGVFAVTVAGVNFVTARNIDPRSMHTWSGRACRAWSPQRNARPAAA
jgi:hypothetical protein